MNEVRHIVSLELRPPNYDTVYYQRSIYNLNLPDVMTIETIVAFAEDIRNKMIVMLVNEQVRLRMEMKRERHPQ